MHEITITAIDDPGKGATAILIQTEQHMGYVRDRAFRYFQERGAKIGNDWADWLRAEREVVWRPRAEMFENFTAIVLRAEVPGFDEESLRITATPGSVTIQGTATHEHGGLETRLRFCEFGRRLFRRFDLPARIEPSSVSATIEKGILEIVAAKAQEISAAS